MTHLLKLNYLFLALWLCVIHSAVTYAADLTFTPASPIVQVGEELTLTVAGATAPVTWSAQKGWIVGIGNEVIYKAPDQAGFDVVTVSDAAGNIAMLKIQLLPKSNLSEENAVWKVFSNLDVMSGFVPLADGKTFLAKSIGGLAQYEVATGELKRMFTQQDGLPDNQVTKFLSDEKGVWIGTGNGLAYYENLTGKLIPYETPLSYVLGLYSDGNRGIWVSLLPSGANVLDIQAGNNPYFSKEDDRYYAVAYLDPTNLDATKRWAVHPLNSSTFGIANDEHGGVWVITLHDGVNKEEAESGVLRHLLNSGEWVIYTTKALGLSGGFDFFSYEPDGQGGLWIGMKGYVVHFSLAGDSQIYSAKEAGLSEEMTVRPLFMNNEDGTLRVSLDDESLFDLSHDGIWTPVTIDRPKGISWTADDEKDGKGGLWSLTDDRHLWYRDKEGKWNAYPDTSNYPYLTLPFGGDVPDGQGGVWVGTQGEGLVHLTSEGIWEKKLTSSKLPSLSAIHAIGHDHQGGGWVFGYQVYTPFETYIPETSMKLIHCKPENLELICDSPVENLPSEITDENTPMPKLLPDDKGGLWLGTNGVGLFYRNPEGQWTTYDTTNSELPNDKVWAIVNDGNGGLWIATSGGLAHLSQDQQWTVYTTSNSGLPNDDIFALETDSVGELWIGIGGGDIRGLVHFSRQGEWTIYTTDNSPLPNNNVTAFLKGENGGLWIGTAKEKVYGGLVTYLSDTGEWTTYETELGSFPRFLLSDQQGGVWASTMNHGLTHFGRNGKSTLFDSHNSGLPSYIVTGLLSDGQGGLWTGNQFGGLAHLTFPEKQTGNRAAIIIASGGNQSKNNLWKATEATANYLYKMLAARKFVNEEIYYLSPKDWADFNGDGFNDRIVDAPRPETQLRLDDIRGAFNWAKERGQLDQPLYVFFMDHGETEKLFLEANQDNPQYLEATDLKAILDDYQTATGNSVVLVIEACYSGSFLPVLSAPNRAVITSAKAEELAYFDEVSQQGFSYYLANILMTGSDLLDSFNNAGKSQQQFLGKLNERLSAGEGNLYSQTPQLDDNGDGRYEPGIDGSWLKQVKINGDLPISADYNTLTIEALTPATTISSGQPLVLQAKVSTASDEVARVWTVIRPPRLNRVIDANGTPILAFPHEKLYHVAETDLWQVTWNNAIYNGEYELTFYAEDRQGNIVGNDTSITITVTGGIDPPPTAQVQIHLEKDRYQRGETFKATLTEDLGWGYDLYAAVLFPDGQNFMTLENTNELRPLNEAKPWYAQRKQSSAITLFDLTLPADLPTGEYCLFGILSPEQNEVFETLEKGLWVMDMKCLEIF